jgi:hypothetical protein
MAENDYIGDIQNQRLNQQWSNSMNWNTPSWMQTGFKQGPRVSQAPRFKPPSIGMRLNWGANEQIMDRGFNKGEKWSERYKDKTAPADTSGTPLPGPTPGTAVTGPTAPATPSTPTAPGTMSAPSSSPMTMASSGGARPLISMVQNAAQQTPAGQTMGQIRTAWGAVRNARAQRRSSGTVI